MQIHHHFFSRDWIFLLIYIFFRDIRLLFYHFQPHVNGELCDQCEFDSFYMHDRGCLRCFCSGVSQQCTSYTGYRTKVCDLDERNYQKPHFFFFRSNYNLPAPIHKMSHWPTFLKPTTKHPLRISNIVFAAFSPMSAHIRTDYSIGVCLNDFTAIRSLFNIQAVQ